VDNFVDKSLLTAGNAIFHAGLRKLLKGKARNKALKINNLKMVAPVLKWILAIVDIDLWKFISVHKPSNLPQMVCPFELFVR
jgi:hypothetical protein